MGVTSYVGARYVPKFSELNNGVWDPAYSYESLIIVKHGNDFFTSKKIVPVGVNILDSDYWVKTGDYNGAIASLDQKIDNRTFYVTPEMFGAIGDGITDDSDALLAACSENKPVILMNKYKVTTGTTLTGHFVGYNGEIISDILRIDQDSVIDSISIATNSIDGAYLGNNSAMKYTNISGDNGIRIQNISASNFDIMGNKINVSRYGVVINDADAERIRIISNDIIAANQDNVEFNAPNNTVKNNIVALNNFTHDPNPSGDGLCLGAAAAQNIANIGNVSEGGNQGIHLEQGCENVINVGNIYDTILSRGFHHLSGLLSKGIINVANIFKGKAKIGSDNLNAGITQLKTPQSEGQPSINIGCRLSTFNNAVYSNVYKPVIADNIEVDNVNNIGHAPIIKGRILAHDDILKIAQVSAPITFIEDIIFIDPITSFDLHAPGKDNANWLLVLQNVCFIINIPTTPISNADYTIISNIIMADCNITCGVIEDSYYRIANARLKGDGDNALTLGDILGKGYGAIVNTLAIDNNDLKVTYRGTGSPGRIYVNITGTIVI